jgi:hypothetical protein
VKGGAEPFARTLTETVDGIRERDEAEARTPLQVAFGGMFGSIDDLENLVHHVTSRLQPVLNPAAMESPKAELAGDRDRTPVSETVATVQLQSLRVSLLNERLRLILDALEV